jgi:hypothetical protein
MQWSPSQIPYGCSAVQEIPCSLCSLKVHYCVHQLMLLFPVLSQMNPIYTSPNFISLRSILLLSSHLNLHFSKCSISFRFSYQQSLLSHACYIPDHHIYLNLITLIIFGKDYNFWSSSLYGYLQPPITSFIVGPNNFLCTMFLNILILYSYLNMRNQVSCPYNNKKCMSYPY